MHQFTSSDDQTQEDGMSVRASESVPVTLIIMQVRHCDPVADDADPPKVLYGPYLAFMRESEQITPPSLTLVSLSGMCASFQYMHIYFAFRPTRCSAESAYDVCTCVYVICCITMLRLCRRGALTGP